MPCIGMADDENKSLRETIAALEEQNQSLMAMLEGQQSQIENLRQRIETADRESERQSKKIEALAISEPSISDSSGSLLQHSTIHISGEAGVVFRAGEANTNFPNEEFGIDEARLFIEAQITPGTYLFSELEFFTRESNNTDLRIGELYLEFEDLVNLGNWESGMTIRLGRLDIPFGEEYQNRDVMRNPLIAHSVSDFWGIDEGIEAFGSIGDFSYIVALQNGSHDALRDYTPEKALTARFGYSPSSSLNFSASAMTTGGIDTENETLSELWFGNGFFRSIGSPDTSEFSVDLYQLDGRYTWQSGQLNFAYGRAWYEDNDPLTDNRRNFEFWKIEGQQELTQTLTAAIRYSGMDVQQGYPVAGMGSRGRYFFGPFMTEKLRRLSTGLSYWPHKDLVLKVDYTLEDGYFSNGTKRTDTDIFTAEVGARF